jgi:hypothetical protein
MRIKHEDEILDPVVRKQIIEEIEGDENKCRKAEAFKRHQVYKDETDYFVIELLKKKFKPETVAQMSYAISNVSLVRKAIDKLARVYAHGVNRKIKDSEEDTNKLQELEKELDFNTAMKTLNRFLKLQRNCAMYVKPCPYYDKDGNEKNDIKLMPLAPYLYDVVEHYYDRTSPMCFILSNYDYEGLNYTSLDPAAPIVRFGNSTQPKLRGDGKDQLIADNKEDEGQEESKKQYIWWTDKYHFTTIGSKIIDPETGEQIDPSADDPRILNPIETLPIDDFAIDRDNSFWAKGGRDLVHGGILVNSLISNYHHIGVEQGYGQIVITGEKGTIPQNIPMGPTNAVVLEHGQDQQPPSFEFKTSGAPLTELMRMVEMYVALILTTNNLSTSGVSTQLEGTTAPSGIAMMIDKAESMEDVQDQRQIFLDEEPEIWGIVNRWLHLFSQDGSLNEELIDLQLPEDFEMVIQFNEQQSIQTEAEKLANIKMRKELGINTMVELIKKDQPNLSDQEAEAKLKTILEEKIAHMETMIDSGLAQDPNEKQNEALIDNKEKEKENEKNEQ